jgi:hypothetical protein
VIGKPRWAGLVIQDEQGKYLVFQLKDPQGQVRIETQLQRRPGKGYWDMFMQPERISSMVVHINLQGEAAGWDGDSRPGEAWDPLAIAQYPPLPLESGE